MVEQVRAMNNGAGLPCWSHLCALTHGTEAGRPAAVEQSGVCEAGIDRESIPIQSAAAQSGEHLNDAQQRPGGPLRRAPAEMTRMAPQRIV
jgi:hypothetical protein